MSGKDLARDIILGLDQQQFAFHVEIEGTRWDVYHYLLAGHRGTIALTVADGHVVVGMLAPGWVTEPEVAAFLAENDAS